jgi:iron complex outermembrane receptor protein
MPTRFGNRHHRHASLSILALALLLHGGNAPAQTLAVKDLAELSLEELSNVAITSVSKRAERLSEAPASVFVITADDIRRSGVTSLPEALRLAPNLQVSRESASGYVISARGFNASNANKLLVLIDGRSVYTPLFSGVFWDVQDLMLEDIDRIEVISGPGGTLWGTNAVNGVINVITRPAGDTQGFMAAMGAGSHEAEAGFRHGGTLGETGHYRVYARHIHRENSDLPPGGERNDAWHKSQFGFRADWHRGGDQITAQGHVYDGALGQPEPGTFSTGVPLALDTISVSGLNLLTRWTRSMDNGAQLSVQGYYDRTERTVPPTFAEKLDILDVQFQYSPRPTANNAWVWGVQYRHAWDRVDNGTVLAFLPARVKQQWVSLFAQDDIRLGETVQLVLGARLERNDYTGNEVLPNARLSWQLTPGHMLWTSASRTVRAPSRIDRDVYVPATAPFLLGGGPDFQSEIAKVYELGYRGQPTSRTSYSVTAFHADYSRLRTLEFATGGAAVVAYGNGLRGQTSGLEMWGTYHASDTLRLSAGYTRLSKRLRLEPGSADLENMLASEGSDPKHRWLLRASMDLPGRTALDATVRRVSALTRLRIPSYTVMDLRLAWQPRADLELSVTAQNLFGRRHSEYEFIQPHRSEFGRSLFLKATSRF